MLRAALLRPRHPPLMPMSSTAGPSGKSRFLPPPIKRLPLPPDLSQPTSIAPFRDAFKKTVPVVAVRVKAKHVGELRQAPALKGCGLHFPDPPPPD